MVALAQRDEARATPQETRQDRRRIKELEKDSDRRSSAGSVSVCDSSHAALTCRRAGAAGCLCAMLRHRTQSDPTGASRQGDKGPLFTEATRRWASMSPEFPGGFSRLGPPGT